MPVGSLDRWPEDYERGRTGWPPEVVDIPGLPPEATVLELGAGTGKLTRLLVPTFGRVVAVEPAATMRRLLVRHVPGAEAAPLGDASMDAVFVAEAFHRFDREHALGEVARVLRPRGALVPMWNLPAGPIQPSIETAERFLQERGPDRAEAGYDPLDLNTDVYASGARGASRSQARLSRSCRRRGSRTRRRSTGTSWSRSLPRWAGSATCPRRSGCHCSTTCSRSSRLRVRAAVGDARPLDAARLASRAWP